MSMHRQLTLDILSLPCMTEREVTRTGLDHALKPPQSGGNYTNYEATTTPYRTRTMQCRQPGVWSVNCDLNILS